MHSNGQGKMDQALVVLLPILFCSFSRIIWTYWCSGPGCVCMYLPSICPSSLVSSRKAERVEDKCPRDISRIGIKGTGDRTTAPFDIKIYKYVLPVYVGLANTLSAGWASDLQLYV